MSFGWRELVAEIVLLPGNSQVSRRAGNIWEPHGYLWSLSWRMPHSEAPPKDNERGAVEPLSARGRIAHGMNPMAPPQKSTSLVISGVGSLLWATGT